MVLTVQQVQQAHKVLRAYKALPVLMALTVQQAHKAR